VANLVGTLAGGDALIGLRSRGQSLHPFDRVEKMQAAAEAQFRRSEQQLQTHLDDTEKQLASLRGGAGTNAQAVITPDQRAAIDKLRADVVETRQQLRAVQLNLKRDIDGLQTSLRLFDIVFVPVVLTIFAIALALVRRGRRRGARA
jgi:ABC-type uncharacterized transport system involved in gliding motility auxiliary subunit